MLSVFKSILPVLYCKWRQAINLEINYDDFGLTGLDAVVGSSKSFGVTLESSEEETLAVGSVKYQTHTKPFQVYCV